MIVLLTQFIILIAKNNFLCHFWGKSSGGSVHLLSNKSESEKVYFYLWSKLARRWIDIGAWDFHWVISYLYLRTSLYFQHINLIFSWVSWVYWLARFDGNIDNLSQEMSLICPGNVPKGQVNVSGGWGNLSGGWGYLSGGVTRYRKYPSDSVNVPVVWAKLSIFPDT